MTRKAKSSAPATNFRTRIATVAPWIVAPIPMVPALLINLEQSADKSVSWLTLAIVAVVMAAVFAESSMRSFRAREYVSAMVFVLGATVAIGANLINALGNAAHTSDSRSDMRQSKIDVFERRSKELIRLSKRRKTQVEIAGEQSPEAVKAVIQQKVAANSRRWRATDECAPAQITAQASKHFCAEVAALQAQLAAARERDAIDKRVEELNAEIYDDGDVPTSQDPMVDRVVALLGLLGVMVDETVRALVKASRDWTYAITVELLASLGPSAILRLLSPWTRPERDSEPLNTATETKQVPPLPAPPPSGDPILGFVAAKLERCEGGVMPAGEMWALWGSYCAGVGCDPGTQKKFTTSLKQWVGHERKNNRPRWVNVKAKPLDGIKPALRVVS